MSFDTDFIKILPVIKNVCFRYKDKGIVEYEDMIQEASVKFWRAYDKYDGRSKLSTYAYRIAKNSCLDILRKSQALRQIKTNRLDDYDIAYEEVDFKKEVQFESMINQINKMGKEDKFLIESYLKGTSYKDVAIILKTSENSIGVKLHRAKSKLKRKTIK